MAKAVSEALAPGRVLLTSSDFFGTLAAAGGLFMLDRSQHLKLFLTGSGDSQEDADAVLSDKRVQEELDRHPVKTERLFKAVRRVSHFKFNSAQEDQFLYLFGRYR
jgi:hypothetical protein